MAAAVRTAPATGTSSASTWRMTAVTALAPIAWGTTFLITAKWLPPGRPLLSGAIRALPMGLLALALTRTLPRGAWWWRSAVLGTLNIGAFFPLLFVAAYRLPGGIAAVLNAVQPLMVAVLAYALLGERPTRWRLGWGAAGVAGVAIMVLRGDAHFDVLGILAGLAALAAMGAGTVLTKKWGRPVGVLTFTGWQLTAGGLLLAPLALLVEGPPPALDGAAIAGYAWISVIGALVAYALWFRGLGKLPVTAMSFLPLLSPAVATVLGWLVMDQTLRLAQGLGFGLALVSVAAGQLSPGRSR